MSQNRFARGILVGQKFINLLLVESDSAEASLICGMLKTAVRKDPPISTRCVDRVSVIKGLLERETFDLAIVGQDLTDSFGLDIAARFFDLAPDIPLIILVGEEYEEIGIRAVESGAVDYLLKGQFDENLLRSTIRYAIELKRLEKASRESKEIYRKLFENIPIGIYRSTLQGNVVLANPALINMLGYRSLAEWETINPERGLQATGLAPLEFRERLEQEGVIKGLETTLKKVDGSTIYVRENARVIREEDGTMHLFEGTLEDVTTQKQVEKERELLLEQIRAGRERLKYVTKRMVSVQEEERYHISRELHDEIGQTLTYLILSLESIINEIPDHFESLRQRIEEALGLVHEMIVQTHDLVVDLRPPALDMLGLNLTLEGFCHEFSRRTQILVEYNGADTPSLPQMTYITLYRFLQESLTNVVKHANASWVLVDLHCDEQIIRLSVKDNGNGFDDLCDLFNPQSLKKNQKFGLIGMKERFELLGGKVQIASQRDRGTQLTGILPIKGSFVERRAVHDQPFDRR